MVLHLSYYNSVSNQDNSGNYHSIFINIYSTNIFFHLLYIKMLYYMLNLNNLTL